MSFLNKLNRNNVLVGIAVIGIIVTGVLISAKSNQGFSLSGIFGTSDNQIAKKAIDYINSNQLSQTPASLVSATEESGLVKIKIKIGTDQFDSWVTKDGKLLFPKAIDMTPAKAAAASNSNANSNASAKTPAQAASEIKKTDKPMLEAFVVSSCPFGLQMQRIIADAVKNVPALASNVTIKYIGNVNSDGKTVDSMHGPEEGAENLRQICIRDEQPAKYYNYISCYMKKTTATASSGMPLGDSPSCQASTGVDTAKLNACVSDPTRGLAYAKKDFDASDKYSVSGSPTLILNGASVSEFDFGGRTSDAVKSIVCAGFTTKPSFCSKTLNTASAAASFSATYASATGGTSANTNCATAQ